MNGPLQSGLFWVKMLEEYIERKHSKLKKYAASHPNINQRYLDAENLEISELALILDNVERAFEAVSQYWDLDQKINDLKGRDPHLGGVHINLPFPDGNPSNYGLIKLN